MYTLQTAIFSKQVINGEKGNATIFVMYPKIEQVCPHPR